MSSGELAADRQVVFERDRIILTLDPAAYGLSAIQKAGYRLAKRCTLLVNAAGPREIHLSLLLPAQVDEQVARGVLLDFLRELGDQQLREQVREETKGIRELVLAHAFSNTDLVSRE
jgi:His-Xaa-Ser system protein HxsD